MKFLGTPQSGSQAALTSGRNRYGQYIRSRAIPVNPQSPAQARSRAAFTRASSQWRDLGPTIHAAWQTWSDQIPITDSLGQSQILSGQAAFVRVNSLIPPAVGLVTTPPDFPTFTGILPTVLGSVIGAATTLTLSSALPATPIGAISGLQIWGAAPVSAGRAFASVRNFLRLLAGPGSGVAVPAITGGVGLVITAMTLALVENLLEDSVLLIAVREVSEGVIAGGSNGGFRPIFAGLTA